MAARRKIHGDPAWVGRKALRGKSSRVCRACTCVEARGARSGDAISEFPGRFASNPRKRVPSVSIRRSRFDAGALRAGGSFRTRTEGPKEIRCLRSDRADRIANLVGRERDSYIFLIFIFYREDERNFSRQFSDFCPGFDRPLQRSRGSSSRYLGFISLSSLWIHNNLL